MKKSFVFLLCLAVVVSAAKDSRADPSTLPVTRFTLSDVLNEVPAGWSLDKKTGKPSLEIRKENDLFYLHLFSPGNSAFGVRKEFRVDVKKYPVLCWRWKANKLPQGGDVRKAHTDDQALQLYVAFKATGFPRMTHTPVIGYIWDNESPKGWSGRSPHLGGDKLRYIVLRNRTDQLGQWYTERRNLYEDYKMLFGDIKGGEPQGLTTGLQIHINSQRTKSPADSLIGEIYFSADPSDIAKAELVREVRQVQDVKISAVKSPPPPIISAPKKQKTADCINISIKFDADPGEVENTYNDAIQTIVTYLIKNPESRLTITGHTDNVGTTKQKLIISEKRAAMFKNYLVDKFNIDQQRLRTKGAGSSHPVDNNDTEEGRQNNRRVTISNCP